MSEETLVEKKIKEKINIVKTNDIPKYLNIPLLDLNSSKFITINDLKKLSIGTLVKLVGITKNTLSEGINTMHLNTEFSITNVIPDKGYQIKNKLAQYSVYYGDIRPKEYYSLMLIDEKYPNIVQELASIDVYKKELIKKAEEEELIKREAKKKIIILEISSILDEVYKDKWDIHYNSVNNDIFDIIIHFPEITIINDSKKQHLIRDLYVKLPLIYDIISNKIRLNDIIQGIRATLTESEYVSSYGHSHLHTSGVMNGTWGRFCLGESIFAIMQRDLQIEYNKDKFEHFLILLEQSYVGWESESGGPYIRISSIKKYGEGGDIINSFNVSKIESIYKEVLKNCSNFNFLSVYSKKTSCFFINPNHRKFLELLNSCVKDDIYRCYEINGNFYPINSNNVSINNSNKCLFIFKNKKVNFNIIKDDIDNKDIKTVCNPYIVSSIVNLLNKDINSYYLQKI